MKKFLSRSMLSYVCAIALAASAIPLRAAVVWTAPGVASDVINDNLVINGAAGQSIALPTDRTNITANSQDITVTVNGPAVINANAVGESQLYVCANNGHKITFDFTPNATLEFLGSSNLSDLVIVFGGTGTVEFLLPGGSSVSFNSNLGVGGTRAYLYMTDPGAGGIATLSFKRNILVDNTPVIVNVGPRSVLSYLSNIEVVGGDNRVGIIQFDPTVNTNTGRMAIDVQDGGALVVAPQKVNVAKDAVTLADLTPYVPGGRNAILRVIKNPLISNSYAGLLVRNYNKQCTDLLINPFCQDPNPFDGTRYGFVLGANGTLQVTANSYFDYVGLANNVCCPVFGSSTSCDAVDPSSLIKKRNPSAFIVDGNANASATPARISLANTAGLFFRSGVDVTGSYTDNLTDSNVFTINPELETPGAGETVLDVEGPLNIIGLSKTTSKTEILSWQVNPTGGPLFINDLNPLIFPDRTFAKDSDGLYRQYNSANFLINDTMSLNNTSLVHSDENHQVYQKNDSLSEPTYIGGERFGLDCVPPAERPSIRFCNSRLLVHTDIAFTGVDLVVPNCSALTDSCPQTSECISNDSNFIFYGNGKCIDQSTGRTMILGTTIGSTACNGCTIISDDAHLDVQQKSECCPAGTPIPVPCTTPLPCDPTIHHNLFLQTDVNNGEINPNITTPVTGQASIHTIFLGHASNISVGSEATQTGVDVCNPSYTYPFCCPTCPKLTIDGCFFSFETRGGNKGIPSLSNVTGQGGIFVDCNGTFCINPAYRASIATMVTKSCNGVIDLPKNQVFFNCEVGTAEWQVNLVANPVIIPELDQNGLPVCLSDYTLNWLSTTKAYCCGYVPYELCSVTSCICPAVVPANVQNIPTIQGEVNQLQIQGSRIGDQVDLLVDGGWVRELVFLKDSYSAQAPVALVVIQNEGRVGVGTAQRNPDSSFAQWVLGANGVSIVANGSGTLQLNEDTIINNVCAFLKGPDFNKNGTEGHVLRINADVPREFRVKKGAALDFSQFTAGDVIEFTGNVKVIMEPGSRIIGGRLSDDGATIKFFDSATINHEPYVKSVSILANAFTRGPIDNSLPNTISMSITGSHNESAPLLDAGQGLRNTDAFRVRYLGKLNLEFNDRSAMYTPQYSYVGVETACDNCGPDTTCLFITLHDQSQFMIGDPDSDGGSFQVGNVINCFPGLPFQPVSFKLLIDGLNAVASIKSGGFLGFGVGMVDNHIPNSNNWLIDNTFNVGQILIRIVDGLFVHDRTYTADNPFASLLAIGSSVGSYDLIVEDVATVAQNRLDNSAIHGGGNMVLLEVGSSSIPGAPTFGAMAPLVRDIDNNIVLSDGTSISRLHPALFASRIMMEDGGLSGASASAFFNYTKVKDFRTATPSGASLSRGTAASQAEEFDNALEGAFIGWVDRGMIGRQEIFDIADSNNGDPRARVQQAIDLGSVGISVDTSIAAPGKILFAQQL